MMKTRSSSSNSSRDASGRMQVVSYGSSNRSLRLNLLRAKWFSALMEVERVPYVCAWQLLLLFHGMALYLCFLDV
jgi:hypothetical protein